MRHKVLFSVLCYPPSFTDLSFWGWFSFVSFHFSSSESVSIIKFFAQTVRGLNDTAEKGQKWQALKEGERGTGNGKRECCGVAGHENKIKFPISSASLLGLSRQKAEANFANNTASAAATARGRGSARQCAGGGLQHTHTYVGKGMSAATWLKYKTQKECQVSLKRQNMWQFLLPHSLSLPHSLTHSLAFAVQIYFSFTIILLDEQAFLFWQLAHSFRLCCIPLPLQQMWFSSFSIAYFPGTQEKQLKGKFVEELNWNSTKISFTGGRGARTKEKEVRIGLFYDWGS